MVTGSYIKYIVLRANLGQFLTHLANAGAFTGDWVIQDIQDTMPRTGTYLPGYMLYAGKLNNKNKQQRCMDQQ